MKDVNLDFAPDTGGIVYIVAVSPMAIGSASLVGVDSPLIGGDPRLRF